MNDKAIDENRHKTHTHTHIYTYIEITCISKYSSAGIQV